MVRTPTVESISTQITETPIRAHDNAYVFTSRPRLSSFERDLNLAGLREQPEIDRFSLDL